jgi:hypothetical protein
VGGYSETMPHWLPKLTLPELGVVLLTIGLCMTASRIGAAGDFVERLFRGGGDRRADRRKLD